MVVKFTGPDVDLLLANRAELLLALEHVTMEMLRMPSEDHSRISFDANDYRLLRIEELRLSAMTAAEKVKRTGEPFRFNPMNSRERRVIHLALRDETARAQRKQRLRAGPAGGGLSRRHGQPARAAAAGLSAARRPARRGGRRESGRDRRPAPRRWRRPSAHAAATVADPGVSLNLNDTIVAISTPPGRGGLGIVRLSGAQARAHRRRAFCASPSADWRPWHAHLAELLDARRPRRRPGGGHLLRSARAPTPPKMWSRSPATARPWCCATPWSGPLEAGARLAEPGEFTLRAFLNGRIDLPQAEAVRDLIDATTLYQARIAAQQAGGSVSRRIAPLKEQLLELIALLEAGIDFAEDDVSVAPAAEILRRLAAGRCAASRNWPHSFQYGGLVRDGLTLAIVGRPNVGKSSLFNRLLEQDRAIVTDIPGTTRDLVSETAAIGGIPVKLYDTAGIREGAELVETLGIERSYQAMADADLTLVVVDLSAAARRREDQRADRARRAAGPLLVVGNKCDLPRGAGHRRTLMPVSALTGEGIAAPARRHPGCRGAARAPSSRRPASSPACATSSCCANRSRIWKRRAGAVEADIPHEMLLLDLYARAAADRRHHRRHHRRRHPEPHLLHILHRQVGTDHALWSVNSPQPLIRAASSLMTSALCRAWSA